VKELITQRTIGICLGYEDLNDHDELRRDPLLATVCGKLDSTGANRRNERDCGIALAGKSTLNRLETFGVGKPENQRYKKITYSEDKIDQFFVDVFVKNHRRSPSWPSKGTVLSWLLRLLLLSAVVCVRRRPTGLRQAQNREPGSWKRVAS
jgi:hypothetical protein